MSRQGLDAQQDGGLALLNVLWLGGELVAVGGGPLTDFMLREKYWEGRALYPGALVGNIDKYRASLKRGKPKDDKEARIAMHKTNYADKRKARNAEKALAEVKE